MSSIFMAASCSLPTASSVTTQQSKLLQQSQTQRSRLYTAQSSIYDEAIMVENADLALWMVSAHPLATFPSQVLVKIKMFFLAYPALCCNFM